MSRSNPMNGRKRPTSGGANDATFQRRVHFGTGRSICLFPTSPYLARPANVQVQPLSFEICGGLLGSSLSSLIKFETSCPGLEHLGHSAGSLKRSFPAQKRRPSSNTGLIFAGSVLFSIGYVGPALVRFQKTIKNKTRPRKFKPFLLFGYHHRLSHDPIGYYHPTTRVVGRFHVWV